MELRSARGRLLALLMLIIAFPLLQQSFPFFESGKLGGAIKEVGDSTFNWNKWWDGSYQAQKNDYLNDNTGCRPDLVRINNQLDYWLFNKYHAYGVVKGKDDYLFEEMYLNEYNGLDFLGVDNIRRKIFRMKKIQDTLEKMGKTFVFIYAPSKAWYYPDKFPRNMEQKERKPTNYETFRRLADSAGVHQIDFNSWFLSMKGRNTDTLFSRVGIHWTMYGALLASDSMIKYIEHARNITLPDIRYDSITHTWDARKTDNDIATGLNLITQFRPEVFTYMKYHFDFSGNRTRPRMIYIGDSFVWVLMNDGLMQNINSSWEFWYYFNEVWSDKAASGLEPVRHMNEVDWASRIAGTDCVVAIFTPANLTALDYEGEFVFQMYQHYYPPEKAK